MLNFCKILISCHQSTLQNQFVTEIAGWAGNVRAASKLVVISAIHPIFPVLVLWACGRIILPGALVTVWTYVTTCGQYVVSRNDNDTCHGSARAFYQ